MEIWTKTKNNVKDMLWDRNVAYEHHPDNVFRIASREALDAVIAQVTDIYDGITPQTITSYSEDTLIVVERKTDGKIKSLVDHVEATFKKQNAGDFRGKNVLFFSVMSKKLESEPQHRIFVINIDEWYYNPYRHFKQPRFMYVPKEKKLELIERYDVKESGLPKMDIKDKIARYFDFLPGDMVEILRTTEMSGIQVCYRVVR